MPQDTPADVQLVFDGSLIVRTADAVRAALRAAIEPPAGIPPGVLAIDCSAASEIDLTFIQLLIAAQVSARAAGRTICLTPRPDGVLLGTLTRGGFHVVPDGSGFWFTGGAA